MGISGHSTASRSSAARRMGPAPLRRALAPAGRALAATTLAFSRLFQRQLLRVGFGVLGTRFGLAHRPRASLRRHPGHRPGRRRTPEAQRRDLLFGGIGAGPELLLEVARTLPARARAAPDVDGPSPSTVNKRKHPPTSAQHPAPSYASAARNYCKPLAFLSIGGGCNALRHALRTWRTRCAATTKGDMSTCVNIRKYGADVRTGGAEAPERLPAPKAKLRKHLGFRWLSLALTGFFAEPSLAFR